MWTSVNDFQILLNQTDINGNDEIMGKNVQDSFRPYLRKCVDSGMNTKHTPFQEQCVGFLYASISAVPHSH